MDDEYSYYGEDEREGNEDLGFFNVRDHVDQDDGVRETIEENIDRELDSSSAINKNKQEGQEEEEEDSEELERKTKELQVIFNCLPPVLIKRVLRREDVKGSIEKASRKLQEFQDMENPADRETALGQGTTVVTEGVVKFEYEEHRGHDIKGDDDYAEEEGNKDLGSFNAREHVDQDDRVHETIEENIDTELDLSSAINKNKQEVQEEEEEDPEELERKSKQLQGIFSCLPSVLIKRILRREDVKGSIEKASQKLQEFQDMENPAVLFKNPAEGKPSAERPEGKFEATQTRSSIKQAWVAEGKPYRGPEQESNRGRKKGRKPREKNQKQGQYDDAVRHDEGRNSCDGDISDQSEGNQAYRGHNPTSPPDAPKPQSTRSLSQSRKPERSQEVTRSPSPSSRKVSPRKPLSDPSPSQSGQKSTPPPVAPKPQSTRLLDHSTPKPKETASGRGGRPGGNYWEQYPIPGDFQESDQFPDAEDHSQFMLRQLSQRNRGSRDCHEMQVHPVSLRELVGSETIAPSSIDDSDREKVRQDEPSKIGQEDSGRAQNRRSNRGRGQTGIRGAQSKSSVTGEGPADMVENGEDRPQFERNKLLIQGLGGKTTEDGLRNFIEAKSGGEEVKDVQMLKNGNALVIMADNIKDFRKINTECEERGLDDAQVSIEQVPVCKSILVTGFSKNVTHNFIEQYFESPRNGGGPVEKVHYIPKSGRAVVVFQYTKDMERVLTRHEEKPHVLQQTQVSIEVYKEFLEVEEADVVDGSGDLGATAIRASEARESKKHDAKPKQLHVPVDPDVMEYVNSTGFQAELNNLMAVKKSEITWKANKKMAVIVYRGEEESNSWQSECVNQLQSYFGKFAKCDVQVSKDFWEAVVAKVPSIRACLGVVPPLVKTIPDSNVARIVSLGTDVKSNEEKVKSKLEEIYREETRKTYLNKKIPNVPEKCLNLLKKIKFAEKLQEKNKELEIKFDAKAEEIYFEGPQQQVTEAAMKFFTQMTDTVEKKLTLSASILEILNTDEGLQTVKRELERNNLEAVFVIEKDATIVGSSAAHADNAARLVNKLMLEEKVQVDEKSKHLLKSAEWLKLCDEINQTAVRVRRNNWNDTYVTGFRDDVNEVMKKFNTFLENNCIMEERFVCASDIQRRYLLELRQEDLRAIQDQLKDFVVSIKKGKDDDDFVISGNKEGLKRVRKEISALIDATVSMTFEMRRQGLGKLFESGKGDLLVKSVEKDQNCAIKVQKNLGRGSGDKEVHLQSVSDFSFFSGDNEDDANDDQAIAVGTEASTLVIAQRHTVSWKAGNIEAEKVDILVSSQGACNQAIVNAGGPQTATPKVGDIAVSSGFSSVSHVIYTNCCKWDNGEGEPTLRAIVKKCLQTGETLGANSIAFPVIGIGNLEFPGNVASRIMLDETVNFCRSNPASNLRDIRFVVLNQDQALTAAFKQEMDKLQPKHIGHSTIMTSARGISSSLGRKKTVGTSGVGIEVLQGDLCQETSDAIVYITSKDLNMDSAGKLSKEVKRRGGQQIQDELNQFGKQSGGTALITSGGNLPAPNIIHLIPDTNNKDHFQQCVERCLQLAEKQSLRSISIPAIGTGAYGMSAVDSASLTFKALTNFSTNFRTLRKVRIVIFEAPMLLVFQQVHQRHSFSSQAGVDQRMHFHSPFKVEVTNGDLTQENSAEAIMNIISADMNMNNAGDLSKAIARQSGPQVQQECNQLGKQSPGTAVLTNGGSLQVPYIIHIIPGSSDKKHLQQCLEEGLRIADTNNFQAISIPCVGTGGYGLTGADSAELTFKALNAFSVRCKSIKKVRVVVFQASMMQEFLREQKKQPLQDIEEEDSDAENAAARQTRRLRRRQVPVQDNEDFVRISVIGKDKFSVKGALKSLKRKLGPASTSWPGYRTTRGAPDTLKLISKETWREDLEKRTQRYVEEWDPPVRARELHPAVFQCRNRPFRKSWLDGEHTWRGELLREPDGKEKRSGRCKGLDDAQVSIEQVPVCKNILETEYRKKKSSLEKRLGLHYAQKYKGKQKRSGRCKGLDDAQVSIEQVPVCKGILVTGFSENVTHDFIEQYFESPRNGGGPVEKVHYLPKSGRAVVVFQYKKDMERVLTRHEEKPHVLQQTQVSIKVYQDFLEVEEVDVADGSGNLGATATGAREARVSKKHDPKTKQLHIPVDPDVMEYINSTGFQAELNNLMAVKKSEITWKANNKMAVIVYRGGEESDSWQSECVDKMQSYLGKFAKCDVQVSKDFWEAVVAKVPSIRACLGVVPPLVKTIPDSNVARIVSLGTDVKSNEEKVKSKLEEIYREETRKTYLKKKIPNVPKKRLIFLKKIKLAEKLQEKNKELEIKFDGEAEEVYLEGPQPQVTEAATKFFTQMTDTVEKKLTLSASVLEILNTDEGLQTVKRELERNNVEAVFVIEKDAIIVGSSAAHADNAARLVNKLMLEEKVQVDEKSKHLLKSAEWLKLCDELNQTAVRVHRNSWNDTYVTGFRDDVTEVIKKFNTFLENNCIRKERFVCESDIQRRYLLELRQDDLRTIQGKLKDFGVKIEKGKGYDDFVISGNREGLKRLRKEIGAVINATESKTFEVKQPGLRKYFDSGKGDRLVKSVEKDQDCAIKVQKNIGRGRVDEEVHLQSVSDGSTSSCDSEDDAEDDQAITVGTDASTLVIAQKHRVSWKSGKIEAEKADVLVSSQGACDEAIIKAGGPQGVTPKVGDIAVSGGFSSVSHVIHTNCCKWNNGGGEPTLRAIVQKCLQTGESLGVNSIAFPIIGTGNLHFPRDTASRIMLDETVIFCRSNLASNLRDIRFVVFNQDQALTAAFKQEMDKLQPQHIGHSAIKAEARGIGSFFGREKTVVTSGVGIEVLQGDLCQETSDAIVNITSKDLNMDTAGKLSKEVKRRGGQQIQDELNQFGKQSGGTALITSGGNLPAPNIIHLIPDTNNKDHLQQCVERCLRLAEKQSLRSISIPAVGTGAYGMSALDSASLIFKALTNFSASFRTLRKIRIVIYEAPMLLAFQQAHHRFSFSSQAGVGQRMHFHSSFKVEVTNGDLTQENSTEAIMNIISPNMNMNNAGDLSKAIARQSGPQVQQECNQLGKQSPGTAVLTNGGNLQVPYIIHIIPGSSDKKHLQQCLEEGLRVADANNFQAISIPCVGTGGYGLTGADSAQLTFKALNAFSVRCKSIKKVRVVVFQASMIQEFLQEQKKQPVRDVEEEDSDSENAAAGQTRRLRRRQVPAQDSEDFVRISVIGKDKFSAEKAVESLKKGFSDACTMEKVESEVVSQLSDKQKDALRKKAKDRDVKLEIEDGVNCIVVRGEPTQASGMVGEIWKEINERTKKKQEEEQAKLVSKNIEWSYEMHGAKEAFDPKANGKIELAYRKEEPTAQVFLLGDKFVIDLKKNSGRGQTSGEQITLSRKVIGTGEGIIFPKNWTPMPNDDRKKEVSVHLVTLASFSPEYKKVMDQILDLVRSVDIVSIERVQNPYLYRAYQLLKQKMETENGESNERQLFHGTNPDNVQKINQSGFDWRFSGHMHGAKYGAGVYFARDASYSIHYATQPSVGTHRVMYLARVLLGQYCKGEESMRKPPPRDPASPEILFDSTVDNLSKPSIFVVYQDSQCYPEYLITFYKAGQ